MRFWREFKNDYLLGIDFFSNNLDENTIAGRALKRYIANQNSENFSRTGENCGTIAAVLTALATFWIVPACLRLGQYVSKKIKNKRKKSTCLDS